MAAYSTGDSRLQDSVIWITVYGLRALLALGKTPFMPDTRLLEKPYCPLIELRLIEL